MHYQLTTYTASTVTFIGIKPRNRRGRMVVGFTTTCATSAYHHKICEFESINIDIYTRISHQRSSFY
jgi:hypothetical protein